jgi:hypothetical protein
MKCRYAATCFFCIQTDNTRYLYRREAIKMLILLPTVPARLLTAVVAIVLVALVNSLAIMGW